jgi:hypothetical protein
MNQSYKHEAFGMTKYDIKACKTQTEEPITKEQPTFVSADCVTQAPASDTIQLFVIEWPGVKPDVSLTINTFHRV